VSGQQTESIVVKVDTFYFEGPALFVCNVQFPDGYTTESAFPLVIGLHGGGSSYESFKTIWKYFENPQFILATPQAPYKWLMGEELGYDWSAWPSGNLEVMIRALKLTTTYIKNLITTLTERYKISEVYLMGLSQGSIITQIAGINNYDLLKGIIILSGPEINHPDKPKIVWPPEGIIREANKLRVFIAHGKSDSIIAIDIAYKSKGIYENFGYNVTFFEFEGGHEVNPGAMKAVERWIVSH
jgi:phospholipase/carboxylesterase